MVNETRIKNGLTETLKIEYKPDNGDGTENNFTSVTYSEKISAKNRMQMMNNSD